MSESNEGQPGDVRSRHFYPHYLNFLTQPFSGSPRISEIKLDSVHQIVGPTLPHLFLAFSSALQDCKLLGRSLLAHRPALHSLPCFAYRVSRCTPVSLEHPSALCSLYPPGWPIAYWCERPELFAEISQGKTSEDRARRVLKWFISTLKGQYTSRNETMGSEKKCVVLSPSILMRR
jgi:hypothetical protein